MRQMYHCCWFFGLSILPLFTVSLAQAQNQLGSSAQKSVDCRIADTAMESASRLRRLKAKHSVPCRLHGRQEVEAYLRETLAKKVPPARIRNEGKVYELLGLVPLGYDYLNSLIELYSDQLGGYYDPDKNEYVMANWLPPGMQMSIAVHELTHALQDQYFDIDSMMNQAEDTSDVLMARAGLFEGDATAVMLDYSRAEVGQRPLSEESDVSAFMMQNITGAMMSSGVSKAPPALQGLLIFPYVSGLRFVHSLLREGGTNAVDAAFKRPPASTKEILHPELYLSGKFQAKKLSIPDRTDLLSGFPPKPVYEDQLGEFLVSTVLSGSLKPLRASRIATAWMGDRLSLFRGEGSELVLLWRTAWKTEQDASRFAEAINELFEKRFSLTGNCEKLSCRLDSTPVGKVEIQQQKSIVDLAIY